MFCVLCRLLERISWVLSQMGVCELVSLLTVLSSPWMCRVTDLAFLLEVLMKNWDFFLVPLSGVQGTRLTGAFRTPYTSLASAVMLTDTPNLYMDKKLYLS